MLEEKKKKKKKKKNNRGTRKKKAKTGHYITLTVRVPDISGKEHFFTSQ